MQKYSLRATDFEAIVQGGLSLELKENTLISRTIADLSEDQSLPRSIRFKWVDEDARPGRSYEIVIAEDPALETIWRRKHTPRQRAKLFHFLLGKRYHWQVRALENGQIVERSAVFDFVTNPMPPRWISVPGITNVRDIGGWPLPHHCAVRQGVLYRSSEMNSHLEISPKGRKILLDELGIVTDLDLRGEFEEARAVLNSERVKWLNIPTGAYCWAFTDEVMDGLRRVFELISEPERYPLLFHCWGGADRAGTVAFLLNGLLGVSKEDLILDYELTSLSIWGERSHEFDEFQCLLDIITPFEEITDSFDSAIEMLLLSIDVSPGAILRLRKNLIVPLTDEDLYP
ncbi:MAG: tyrosine-protein phosphatase [Anaerolineaceae bacterium]|nr:tyrosine-protein phosphatase [Anaerolineaceae bacterium]